MTGQTSNTLQRLPERVSRYLSWLAGGFILFGCSLPITIDVIARLLFNRGLVDSFNISGYSFAACIGLGLAFTVTRKANIRIDLATSLLPARWRVAADLAAAIGLAIMASALAWFAWGTFSHSWDMGTRSISSLRIPVAIPQAVWFAGLAWFAVVAVLVPLNAILSLVSGNRDEVDRLIRPADVSLEIEQSGGSTISGAPKLEGVAR